uniref:Phosphodiesterase n=1 Tax=Macrostomum lignano TaxID=282301 RepID=A0A1I8J257_9PLAT
MPAPGEAEASYSCSIRLRKIAKLVASDGISKDALIKNLTYAAQVLESVYLDETRRLCNEEDELPEVPSGEVPNEVRDWLASTFTRSQTSLKQHREKPKFRSVANAIRAGIMVERLSSSSNINVPQNVLVLLKAGLDDWCFNIFELNEASDNHALKFVGFELLHKYDLINKFKINTNVLENFLTKCEEGYSRFSNPYHNLVHGADVAQTCHFIMSSSKLVNWLTDLEIFATIFAAIIHDYEHTGTTNNFHVNTASELALLYNDKGVLENHHASAVFRLMKLDEFNIISGLSREEYKEFRALVIDMVLNTDMSLHFQQIKNMKQLLSMPENIDKEKALALMLHCADISHPGKRFDLHQRWTMSLLEEFFRQGDREKALDLPCSPLCDRSTTMVAQSQVGFIDFIMEPSFGVLGDMLEKILMPLFEQQRQHGTRNPVDEGGAEGAFVLHRPWNEHLKTNRALWKEKADIEEAERAAAVESTAADGEKSSDAAAEQSNQQPPTAPGSSRQLDTIREDKH